MSFFTQTSARLGIADRPHTPTCTAPPCASHQVDGTNDRKHCKPNPQPRTPM